MFSGDEDCFFYFMNLYNSLFDSAAPPVTDIEPVTTNLREHISTENTITIEINTEYFKNDNNGKQVFFGIAVCAKSKCEGKVFKGLYRLTHKKKLEILGRNAVYKVRF